MTIWKYPFEIADDVTIEMPEGARVLDVQIQRGQPCLWAVVDPSRPLAKRRFVVYGTGHEVRRMSDAENHVGTFQMLNGALVWHMFEVYR